MLAVSGLSFQLPLDTSSPVDTHLVTNSILPEKDVDGYVFYWPVVHMFTSACRFVSGIHTDLHACDCDTGSVSLKALRISPHCIPFVQHSNIHVLLLHIWIKWDYLQEKEIFNKEFNIDKILMSESIRNNTNVYKININRVLRSCLSGHLC